MKIGIIGTGAYALALSMMFNENTHDITMWTKFNDELEYLKTNKTSKYIDIKIPDYFKFTTSMEELVKDKDLIVIAIPGAYVNDIALELKKYYNNKQHICIASKGIEQGSCLFLTEVLEKHIKTKHLAVISGGTFAVDMIKKVPLGLSLATKNSDTEEFLKKSLQNNYLKLRTTTDIIGIEVCGAIKNVIAIASGILNGLDFPESTISMFITESLHDIKNLIKALGGSKKTILSYAGFGDLLLTCTSNKSRNYTLGKMLGEKKDRTVINNYIENTTIEGLYTLKSIYKLIKKKKVDMPIIDLIYNIVIKDEDPNKLATFLINKK